MERRSSNRNEERCAPLEQQQDSSFHDSRPPRSPQASSLRQVFPCPPSSSLLVWQGSRIGPHVAVFFLIMTWILLAMMTQTNLLEAAMVTAVFMAPLIYLYLIHPYLAAASIFFFLQAILWQVTQTLHTTSEGRHVYDRHLHCECASLHDQDQNAQCF